jgi:hypothetical protein
MATVWSDAIGSKLDRIKGLNKPQLFSLAYQCLSHAYAGNRSRFQTELPAELFRLAESVMNHLSSLAGSFSPTDATEKLASQLGDLESLSDSHGLLVPGWDTFVMAMIFTLPISRDDSGQDSHQTICDALEYSYLSISEFFIHRWSWKIREGGRIPRKDDNEETAQRESPVCSREIAYQLKCIEKACGPQP